MKKFFVGCNIHFEHELEKELQEFWPFLIGLDGRPHAEALKILEVIPGGVLLEAPLHLGLQINFFSKLANRVLLRLQEFKVRDFPKMFQKFSELKKDSRLQNLKFSYQVAAQTSRLNNEKRIHQILVEILGPENPDSNQNIYVRMSEDLCTVSLDCTGTHLHKRSERLSQGAAPLRETLAAFCLRKLIGERSSAELRRIRLVDPMCGTGTLLHEASVLFQPSIRRDFSFLEWDWTPKILKSSQLLSNYPPGPRLFSELVAFDQDPEAILRAQNSLQKLQVPFQTQVQDLFSEENQIPENQSPTWVVANAPYGERIKADFEPIQVLEAIQNKFRPQKVGLLFSDHQARLLEKSLVSNSHLGLKLQEQWSFQNGGLAVRWMIFERQNPSA